MPGSHLFHLQATPPQKKYSKGTRIDSHQKQFPVLNEMALSFLSLDPQGFREPHWHPNAHELSYCLEGKALMTIFAPGAEHHSFIIEPGTLAFVPMGYLHHIQNVGNDPVKMLICFSDSSPEEINLSSTLASIPSSALGSTFSLPSSYFEGLHPSLQPIFIGEALQEGPFPLNWQTNRYKVNVENMQPQIRTAGGSVTLINQFLMTTLEGLTMYRLKLEAKGVREPHWHPNAHELNYLIKGRVRINLLSPHEKLDSFEMAEGDLSFLPKGYFHYIENIGEGSACLAVFFNHPFPSDIGLTGSLGAYSNKLLARLFQTSDAYLNPLPKYQEDLFVVPGGG